jgi:hypothetical protein
MEKKIKLPDLQEPVLPAHAGDRPVVLLMILSRWIGQLVRLLTTCVALRFPDRCSSLDWDRGVLSKLKQV